MNEIEIAEKHKKIGLNVAMYRKKRGMSQLELSLNLGHKSVSIVASAERFYKGKHFNIEHLLKISEILDVQVCAFLSEGVLESCFSSGVLNK